VACPIVVDAHAHVVVPGLGAEVEWRDGAQIVHYRGNEIRAARFDESWCAAEETGALVFIHPSTRGFALPVMDEHYMWNTTGNPFETTITAAHMIGSGLFERHPRVRALLAHGGGALPFLRGRLAHEQEIHPPGHDVRGALKHFYVDTVVHDADVLRALIEFFGVEHVLLGSDYPFDMGVRRPTEIVRALGLKADEEVKILGGNARSLRRHRHRAPRRRASGTR
jgi:aminocarboxymuconate-semialdehyde decarboxylase